MKPALFFCLLAVALTGCSTLSRRQVAAYGDYGVSDTLYAKMQHGRKLNLPDIVELSQHEVHSSEIMAYLAYSNTEIPLNYEDARQLAREKVNGDVITYPRENPNHVPMLSAFSSWDADF